MFVALMAFAAAVPMAAALAFVDTFPAPCTLHVLDVPPDDYRYSYYLRLLELVLARTEPAYGHCQVLKEVPVSHTRKFRMMKQRELDIIWNVATKALESDFLPVRIPVHLGLHGFRLLVIRKGEEARFQDVTNIASLKPLVAGIVNDWQATEVLEANGLPTEKTPDYENLYPMLKHRRFDYIPLDLVEAYPEMERRSRSPLVIAPKILLHYDSLDFYFVAPENTALAKRLADGLDMVNADGSRNELFDSFFSFDKILKQADISARRVIELRNPEQLPELAPAYRSLVFSVDGLIKRQLAKP